jgi:hypothetical protein
VGVASYWPRSIRDGGANKAVLDDFVSRSLGHFRCPSQDEHRWHNGDDQVTFTKSVGKACVVSPDEGMQKLVVERTRNVRAPDVLAKK